MAFCIACSAESERLENGVEYACFRAGIDRDGVTAGLLSGVLWYEGLELTVVTVCASALGMYGGLGFAIALLRLSFGGGVLPLAAFSGETNGLLSTLFA